MRWVSSPHMEPLSRWGRCLPVASRPFYSYAVFLPLLLPCPSSFLLSTSQSLSIESFSAFVVSFTVPLPFWSFSIGSSPFAAKTGPRAPTVTLPRLCASTLAFAIVDRIFRWVSCIVVRSGVSEEVKGGFVSGTGGLVWAMGPGWMVKLRSASLK